jgi:hypothetical protein
MNSLPGFTADASVYRTHKTYRAAGAGGGGGAGVVPQMAVGMSGDLLNLCRLACAYCSHYGLYCWPCYICGWIIELGW